MSLTYLELLRRLHELLQPAGYLEIGVGRGDSLRLSRARSIAIDPAPHPQPKSLLGKPELLLYVGTSDAFFGRHEREGVLGESPLDLAFIDGLHTFPQVVRDLQHIERWGHARTVVAIHDVLPRNTREAATQFRAGAWTGDVWRVVSFLAEHRPDLRCWLTDADPTGMLIVTRLDPNHPGMDSVASALHREMLIVGPDYDRLVASYISATVSQPAEGVLCALSERLDVADTIGLPLGKDGSGARGLPDDNENGQTPTPTPAPDAFYLPPTRQSMPRQYPDPWLHEVGLGRDFWAYRGVGDRFHDPPARITLYDTIFFDAETRVALDGDGRLIRINLPMASDASRLETHAPAIRDRIRAGDIAELDSDGPFALLPSPRHDNYYHFLYEDLGRLGYYDELAESARLRFPVPPPRPWQRQLYELARVETRLIEMPLGIVRLPQVWVAPRGLGRIDEIRSRAFDFVLALAERVPALAFPGPQRIYVSRAGTSHRRVRNEAEVRQLVEARGFAIVQPETMPVADQIRLFRGAEVVLGVFGAGLANAAFMRPGGRLLEIAPSRQATPPIVHNAIFSSLAGVVGLRYGLLSAPSASVDAETHDFTVPLDWLEQLLDGGMSGEGVGPG